MRKPRITVVGSFVVGLTIRLPRLPVLGESLFGDEYDLGPGGKGSNQAIAAARLGADASLLACVGDDLLAQVAWDTFRREGIDPAHIREIPGVNTAVGVVQLLPGDDNWIVGHLGANAHMRPEDVDAAAGAIAESDVVLMQFETPAAVIRRTLELGRAHGVRTLWNPAPARPVPPDLLGLADILTPNQTELRILLDLSPDDPTPDEDLARRLLDLGVRQLAVTRGASGALLVTAEGIAHVPSVAGLAVVDVTGAGDSFNAALAVGLAEGLDLERAAARACCAGAFAVQRLGVIDGLPTRAELDDFIATKGA